MTTMDKARELGVVALANSPEYTAPDQGARARG